MSAEQTPAMTCRRGYLVHNGHVVGDGVSGSHGIRLRIHPQVHSHYRSRLELRFIVRHDNSVLEEGEKLRVYLTRHNVDSLEVLTGSSAATAAIPLQLPLNPQRCYLTIRVNDKVRDPIPPHAVGLYTDRRFGGQDRIVNQLRSLFCSAATEFHIVVQLNPTDNLEEWKGRFGHLNTRFEREGRVDPLYRYTCGNPNENLGNREFHIHNVPPIEKQPIPPADIARLAFMDMVEYTAVMVTANANSFFLRHSEATEVKKDDLWGFTALLNGLPKTDGALYGFLARRKPTSADPCGDEDDEKREQSMGRSMAEGSSFHGTFELDDKGRVNPSFEIRVVGHLPMRPSGSFPVCITPLKHRSSVGALVELEQLAYSSTSLSRPCPIWITLIEQDPVLEAQVKALHTLRTEKPDICRLLLANEPDRLPKPRQSLAELTSCGFEKNIHNSQEFESLDSEQREVVKYVLSERPPGGISLVGGVQGTDKTSIVEKLARHAIATNSNAAFERRVKILVLTQFHTVADRLTASLLEFGTEHSGIIVRYRHHGTVYDNIVKEAQRRRQGGSSNGCGETIDAGSPEYWILNEAHLLDSKSQDHRNGVYGTD